MLGLLSFEYNVDRLGTIQVYRVPCAKKMHVITLLNFVGKSIGYATLELSVIEQGSYSEWAHYSNTHHHILSYPSSTYIKATCDLIARIGISHSTTMS